ncbi:MAG: hypothetical protein AAF195_03640 [Pseudomonadota bacterium]
MSENQDEMRKIIKESVQETLFGLGFDISDMREMQKDLLHLRKIRTGSEELSKKTRATILGVTVTSAIYVGWEVFKRAIKGQ